MAKFGPNNPPPGIGRPKGGANKLTLFRRQLADLIPEARAQLAEGVKNGDPKLLPFFFSLILPPLKAAFPPVAINFDGPPRDTVTAVKAALSTGDISIDHAHSILDMLVKLQRLETALALSEATLVEATPLETAQTVINTAVKHGDLDTVMATTRSTLPYTAPRPAPAPPEPTGTVSAEPIEPFELSAEEWMEKFGDKS